MCTTRKKPGGGTKYLKIMIGSESYAITKDTENYIEWYRPGYLEMQTRAWKSNQIAPTLTTDCGRIMILIGEDDG